MNTFVLEQVQEDPFLFLLSLIFWLHPPIPAKPLPCNTEKRKTKREGNGGYNNRIGIIVYLT